jgi:hypothetical protein
MLRQPLTRTRFSTGLYGLKAVLHFLVRSKYHEFVPLDFLVDSGANITTVSVALAKRYGIPVPKRVVAVEVRTSAGIVRQYVHPGNLTLRVPGFSGRVFVWPCHYAELPANQDCILLGLSGVIDDLRIVFDGAYSVDAPYGSCIIEEVSRT